MRQPKEATCPPQAVPMAAKEMLQSASKQETDTALPSSDIVRLAAEKSQLMDDLLDEEPIPSDYGQVMVGLFHGLSQDVYTRDFAVQVASSLSLLKRLADDPKENTVVRKSASHALRTLDGQ